MSISGVAKAAGCLLALLWIIISPASAGWSPTIPKVWDEEALRDFELPLPQNGVTVKYISAPLYTNNELTPVQEFQIPGILSSQPDILQINVETGPNLTLHTRRG